MKYFIINCEIKIDKNKGKYLFFALFLIVFIFEFQNHAKKLFRFRIRIIKNRSNIIIHYHSNQVFSDTAFLC